MFNVTIFLFMLERTRDPVSAALIVAAGTFPAALTGPMLGAWLEAVRQPRLLIGLDQATSAVALAALLVSAGEVSIPVCAAIAVLHGATRPLSIGGFARVIPELVGSDELRTANALDALSFQVAFIVGPLLASLFAHAGASFAVFVQLILTAATTVVVLWMRDLDRIAGSAGHLGYRAALQQGWSALRDHRDVARSIGLTVAWISVTGWWVVLFPLLADRLLGAPEASGVLWAFSACGAIAGTLIWRTSSQPKGKRKATDSLALCIATATTILWLVPSPVIIATATFFVAAAAAPATLTWAQVRLVRTPPRARGSVFTLLGSLALASSAGGTVVAGAVAHMLGVVQSVLVLVGLMCTLVIANWVWGRR